VLVVDCGRDEIIARIAVGDGPLHAAQSPAQRRVFVTDSYSNTVSVIRDTTTAAVADEPGHERKGLPAVVRATLRLSGASGEILDVAGRRVLELQIGDDDMSRVRPGVYFVRQDDGSATAKILVAR
jgi:YVTN family beta-propeller protein